VEKRKRARKRRRNKGVIMAESKCYIPTMPIELLARKHVEAGVNDGMFCTDVEEDVPIRHRATCEKVINGKNNAYIVLGRDRPSTIVSGAGGMGQTQCGMIDVVVGLNAQVSSKKTKKGEKPKGPDQEVSPSFATDAARLYMSQRCVGDGGIDGYLGLTRTSGPSARNKSAVAIKADHVRLVGRECVRIYAARSQNFQGLGMGGEKTTLGTRITKGRIDLVAGREKDLQPAVLGNNLISYLRETSSRDADILRVLIDIIEQMVEVQTTIIMLNPALGKNYVKNIINTFDFFITNLNKKIDGINYLDELIVSGGASIVSNTVFVT
tara:strand:- start:4134 stop:5105 length:972 start_codon:yes stop_codon:yes gene_type:complete